MNKIIFYFFLIIITISFTFVKPEESEIQQKKCKIALLLSGDFNDLGYNYQMNNARSNAEGNLTLEYSLFYKNLETSGLGEEAIIDAVEKGANLIIVSSSIHTQLGYKYAEIHKDKDIYWLIRGRGRPSGNLPKVTVITFNAFVLHYALGYFSGLQSKTGVVGFVAPGVNILSSSNANSFYLGAINARPDIQFVNIETGSWLNPEVSYKAAQFLISKGADFLGMSQDDMSVQQAIIDSGSLGLGATGYNSSLIYGADIALSYITDWSQMFITYAGHVLNDTFPINGTYFTSLAQGGSLKFGDIYSYKVNSTIKDKSMAEIEKLKDDNYQPFRCSPMYADIGIAIDSSNCIDDKIFTSNKLYLKGNAGSAFTNFGTYTIPIEFVDYSTSLKYGISISSGICIFLCFVSIFLVLLFRKAKIIKSASPIFCCLILFGCIIIFCGCIIFAQSPTDATCSARVWLLSIGYSIFLGNLLVKNWRIWLLFDNPHLKKRTLTNWKLYPWVMGILAADVLILSLWHSLGNIHAESRIGIDSLSKYQYRNVCSSGEQGTTALYILIVFHGLMLIIACFISFKIKVVDIDEFNESGPISKSVYIITFCLFIVIPLMVSDLTVEGQTTIICVCAIVTTIVGIGLLFGSKFYKMATKGLALNQTFATSTKSSSLSMSNGGIATKKGNNNGIEDEDSEESDIVFGVKDENNANLKHNKDRLANFSSDENTSAKISRQQSHMAHFSSDTEDQDDEINNNNNNNNNVTTTNEQQQQSPIQSQRLSNELNGESEINQNNI